MLTLRHNGEVDPPGRYRENDGSRVSDVYSVVDMSRSGKGRKVMKSLVATLVVAVCALALVPARIAADPVLEVFRTQLEMERRLMSLDLAALERVQEELRVAADRVLRLSEDLIRAQRDGEDASALTARSADVRRAEADLQDRLAASHEFRAKLTARRNLIEQLQTEVKRLEGDRVGGPDELSGRWEVVIEPGGQRGTFEMRLDGTVVTGVYQLAGGWRGSLRGTLIGGNARLERIDSQLGLAAIYVGRLVSRDGERRLEGTWEATNLAAGLPTSGTWVGRRPGRDQ